MHPAKWTLQDKIVLVLAPSIMITLAILADLRWRRSPVRRNTCAPRRRTACSLPIVCHGRVGATAEALRAGKPQIVVPFFGDQPDHGARVERFGVGMTVRLSDYYQNEATGALNALLASGHALKAEAIARSVKAEHGAEALAHWVDGKLVRAELETSSIRSSP